MQIERKDYCTLFDSMYADKGIVMIQSIRDNNENSNIYVLCMDELCYSIISSEGINSVIPIKLEDFLDDDLRTVRPKRGKGEFCWTCTGKLIKHIFEKYGSQCCTYVDSDLFFYVNPDCLVDEMVKSHCSVQVVPHRFPNNRRWKSIEVQSGKNCVQFNTFLNTKESIELLDKWISQCIAKCDRDSGGDQLYTSDWGDYPFVNVSQNDGSGLAPWNIEKYVLGNNKQTIIRKSDSKEFQIAFYHFQGIEYYDRYKVNIHIRNKITHVDKKLINELYVPYLLRIESVKSKLERVYGIVPLYSHSTGLFKDRKQTLKQRISNLVEAYNIQMDTINLLDYMNM